MPNVNLRNTIVLELTNDEFRLIGLALASNNLKGRSHHAALELNVQLTQNRARQMAEQLEVVQGACLRAQEALDAAGSEQIVEDAD